MIGEGVIALLLTAGILGILSVGVWAVCEICDALRKGEA